MKKLLLEEDPGEKILWTSNNNQIALIRTSDDDFVIAHNKPSNCKCDYTREYEYFWRWHWDWIWDTNEINSTPVKSTVCRGCSPCIKLMRISTKLAHEKKLTSIFPATLFLFDE